MNKAVMRLSLTLMVTAIGASGAIKCHVWREILPCECPVSVSHPRTTSITCKQMPSFGQVSKILEHSINYKSRNFGLIQKCLQNLLWRISPL